jgi:hypothetical protein
MGRGMRSTLPALLVISMTACGGVVGTYRICPFGCAELVLRADHTFRYHGAGDVGAPDDTTGTWESDPHDPSVVVLHPKILPNRSSISEIADGEIWVITHGKAIRAAQLPLSRVRGD